MNPNQTFKARRRFHLPYIAFVFGIIATVMLPYGKLSAQNAEPSWVNITVVQTGYVSGSANGARVRRDGDSVSAFLVESAPYPYSGNFTWSCTYEDNVPPGGRSHPFFADIESSTGFAYASTATQTVLMMPNQTVSIIFYIAYNGGTDQQQPQPTAGSLVDDSNDGVPRTDSVDQDDCDEIGMTTWHVSEPYISLWLRDEPLGYQPALGARVSFKLGFKQREMDAGFYPAFFGVGKKWNCSWLSYVSTNGGFEVVNFPNGGKRTYYVGVKDYLTKTGLAGDTANGYTLTYPDGRQDIYGFVVNDGSRFMAAFLSEHRDAQGRATSFVYDPVVNLIVRLRYVIDGDGRTNTISYVTTNAYSTNLISQVTDPFGRTTTFNYDDSGRLTNITDVAGISSSFAYLGDIVTALTTPYGTTQFSITEASSPGNSPSGRSVLITEPDGSRQLYLYKDDAPSVQDSYTGTVTNNVIYDAIPFTYPIENNFEYTGMATRNTFHWGPRQYTALSTTNVASFTGSDFRKPRMRHWPLATGNTVGEKVSMEREPSPDPAGGIPGQTTWYGYSGSDVLPLCVGRKIPDGLTQRSTTMSLFTRWLRNSLGAATNELSTYSASGTVLFRTNIYVYAANAVDLLAVTNALGVQVFSNAYNAYHQVLTNFNALNEQTIFAYNANQQLTSVKWPTGLTTTNVYFTSGLYSNWLAQVIDIEIGRTNSFTYTNGLVYTHTDPRGLTTTNTWDALQRLLATSDSRGTVSFTYTNLSLIRTVDRMRFTNSFGYDSMRRMTAATNALGYYALYDYCSCGSLNSVRDAANNYTYFFYDNAGRMTNAVYPDSYAVTNRYNLPGQLTDVIDSAGTRVTNWFNNQGLLVAVSNAFGRSVSIVYDALDRATNSVDANGVTGIGSYDNLNRILTQSYPDGGVEKWAYTLNVAGATSYTNQLGTNVVNYAYDTLGRKTNEIYPGIATNSFTYSSASDLLTLKDGKNQVTTWHYDQFGRATNKVDAASNEIFRYGYDADDRLTRRWTPAKGETFFTNDAVGNLTFINYPSSPDITLQYDALNWLTNMVDAVGTTKFAYNAVGQLLSEDEPWSSDTVSYTYNNRLRASLSLLQPSGSWTNGYLYDAAKRLTNVTSQAGAFGYAYDATRQMQVKKLSLPGGSFITNSFDDNARLLSTVLKNSTNGVLNSHTYGFNTGNQRTALTNTAGDYRNYTYDNIGQLITASGFESGGTVRLHEKLGYSYDAAGNLNYRTNNAFIQTFNANSLNELTTLTRTGTVTVAGTTSGAATNVTVNSLTATRYTDLTFAKDSFPLVNGTTNFTAIAQDGSGRSDTKIVTVNLAATNNFAYDLNGNLLTNGVQILEYDDENQLIRATVTNQFKKEFVYDGANRLRIRREFSWSGSAWTQTNEMRLVYDGVLPIQHRDSNNVPTLTLTRGRDLSGSLQGAGGIGGLLAMTENSGVHSFYHADGNGNVTCLINANQLIVARRNYDPFGRTLSYSGLKSDVNRYWFSTELYDSDFDFYHYPRRVYIPALHRWPNRDPIGEYGGINLYRFVGNEPEGRIDAFGLYTVVRPYPQPGPPGWEPRGGFFYNDHADIIWYHPDPSPPPPTFAQNVNAWAQDVGPMDAALMFFGPEDLIGEFAAKLLGLGGKFLKWCKPAAKGIKSAESSFSFEKKIAGQLKDRGWDTGLIDDVIAHPHATSPAFNKAANNQATAFFAKDGSYVVRDNVTGEIIQISKRGNPNWIPDPTITNPYKP